MSLRRPLLLVLFCVGMACCLLPGFAQRGDLDDFERDTRNAYTPASEETHHDYDCQCSRCRKHHHDHDRLTDTVARIFWYAVGESGAYSWHRVTRSSEARRQRIPAREAGDPTLPFARLDSAYRSISGDISAVDTQLEVGYGPLGLHYTDSIFTERSPADTLRISSLTGLYRMSFGTDVEVDLGIGETTVQGNTRASYGTLTTPVLLYPNGGNLGFEFRPAWSSAVSDYDLAVHYAWPYAALKTGYRITESPNRSLNGMYWGVSVRY